MGETLMALPGDGNKLDRTIAHPDIHRARVVSLQDSGCEFEVGLGRRLRTPSRLFSIFAVATTVIALSACSQASAKTYDIQPVFPLSADKCAKYDGKAEGTGIMGHCWV